jgi:tetratricopeptide (TPR) repeat protein/acylphosphatase
MVREVFYRNDCIKPRLIAIRGAWISGGIEFNFPVSHSVYTHSRIPHMTRENPDGSASMVFGLTEQMTGMRFTVEVNLAPDEYRFSERVRLYNGTPLPHRHYWWTNAAVQCTPETEMVYPMIWGISGAYGERTTWPVHDGVDLSKARNHRSAGDVFAGETYDDFFGVYHHDLGCGVAHWARQDELPARKMFFWGADEMGKLWQSMLTENAGEYLEIQAGRFATQSDFDLLMPHELVEFTECWIPIGAMEGYVKAHPNGAINVVADGDSARIAVQLTRVLRNGLVRVTQDGALVREIRQDFEPGAVEWFEVPCPVEHVAIEVLSESGESVLRYDPSAKESRHDTVPRTCVMPRKIESPDEMLQAAQVYERMDSPASALEQYTKLLGTEHDISAQEGIARFARLAGRTEDAAPMVRDPKAPDPISKLMAAVSARKLDQPATAQALLSEIPSEDPLWRHPQWESYFLSPASPIRNPQSEIRNGMFFQEDMDAAAWYFDLGLLDEARAIIQAWADADPPEDPFFDALASELGVEIPTKRRTEFGVVNCFAHRDMLLRLLEKRADPEAQVHIGNMLCARGRTDEAIEAWRKARDAGIRDHAPCRNLALAYWQRKDDVQIAYRFMNEASEVCPSDADTLRDLDILAELAQAYGDRPAIAERILRHAPNDSACLERAIRVYLEIGRLDEAVELLTTKQFFVAELAYQTRILYVRALLTRGTKLFLNGRCEEAASDFRQATEYPANLGASRFHDSSDAQAFYLLGLSLERLGRALEAKKAWETAADDVPVQGSEQAFYVGHARERIGRADADDAFSVIVPSEEATDSAPAQARRWYLMGLKALAAGEPAQEQFKAARDAEAADPVKLHGHLEWVCYTRSEGRRVPIPVWWTLEPAIPHGACHSSSA